MKIITKSTLLMSGLLLAGSVSASDMIDRAQKYDAAIKDVLNNVKYIRAEYAKASPNLSNVGLYSSRADKAMTDANGYITDIEVWAPRVQKSSRTPDINDRNAFNRAMGSMPWDWAAKKRTEQATAAAGIGGTGTLAQKIADLGKRPVRSALDEAKTAEAARIAAETARAAAETAKATALASAGDAETKRKEWEDLSEKLEKERDAVQAQLDLAKAEIAKLKADLATCEDDQAAALMGAKTANDAIVKYKKALNDIDEKISAKALSGDLTGPDAQLIVRGVIDPLKAESYL